MTKEIKGNAGYKGDGWAAQVLERVYGRKWLTVLIPLAVAAVMMVVYVLFSAAPDRAEQAVNALVSMVFVCVGISAVLGTQLINPACSAKFMDIVILLATAIYGLHGIRGIFALVFSLKDGFQPGYAVSCVIISVLALLQRIRK